MRLLDPDPAPCACSTPTLPRALAPPLARPNSLFEYPFKSPGDPTGPVRGAVTVTSDDTARLNEGEFLNDTLIDFQIKWIIEHADAAALQRSVIYNSFFHRKLQKLWCRDAPRSRNSQPPATPRPFARPVLCKLLPLPPFTSPRVSSFHDPDVFLGASDASSATAVRKQPQLDRFTAMARWNREDIFTKDILIIPMNEAYAGVTPRSQAQVGRG